MLVLNIFIATCIICFVGSLRANQNRDDEVRLFEKRVAWHNRKMSHRRRILPDNEEAARISRGRVYTVSVTNNNHRQRGW